jgi:lipopolysaccharide/colanic/teichoic acid biosynthesis glycosyltransferase
MANNMITKRIFDFGSAFIGMLLLSPLFLIISIAIVLETKGGIFYTQVRVGKGNRDFRLFKFRTMKLEADKEGFLTIGNNDHRITRVGRFLRKNKLDELPQLLNILNGTMSIVGPRPEVRKYVMLYDCTQAKVLTLKPGLTDYASLAYMNENELLAKSARPEEAYIETIMPAKLNLNLKYLEERNFFIDLKIIYQTIIRIIIKH